MKMECVQCTVIGVPDEDNLGSGGPEDGDGDGDEARPPSWGASFPWDPEEWGRNLPSPFPASHGGGDGEDGTGDDGRMRKMVVVVRRRWAPIMIQGLTLTLLGASYTLVLALP